MQFEVEQKFRIASFQQLERLLAEMSVSVEPSFEQVDCYFAHPSRDFGVTDEAFRLRRTGESNRVTYKGPKIDSTTKTRRELELPLPDGEKYLADFGSMLELLGFRRVAEVHKTRRKAHVHWDGVEIEVSLDDVAGVGTFVELELPATNSTIESMKQKILSLAQRLGLSDVERRSYLALLLQSRPVQ